MAWLSAPIVDSQGRRSKSRREQMTRLAETADEEPDYQMPDPGPLEYLLGYLAEIGEAEISGGHLSIIGWRTMQAWADMTGVRLTAGEALGLRRLSSAYVSQYYQSESSSCAAPHLATIPAREEVASKMKSLFSMLRSPANG